VRSPDPLADCGDVVVAHLGGLGDFVHHGGEVRALALGTFGALHRHCELFRERLHLLDPRRELAVLALGRGGFGVGIANCAAVLAVLMCVR